MDFTCHTSSGAPPKNSLHPWIFHRDIGILPSNIFISPRHTPPVNFHLLAFTAPRAPVFNRTSIVTFPDPLPPENRSSRSSRALFEPSGADLRGFGFPPSVWTSGAIRFAASQPTTSTIAPDKAAINIHNRVEEAEEADEANQTDDHLFKNRTPNTDTATERRGYDPGTKEAEEAEEAEEANGEGDYEL